MSRFGAGAVAGLGVGVLALAGLSYLAALGDPTPPPEALPAADAPEAATVSDPAAPAPAEPQDGTATATPTSALATDAPVQAPGASAPAEPEDVPAPSGPSEPSGTPSDPPGAPAGPPNAPATAPPTQAPSASASPEPPAASEPAPPVQPAPAQPAPSAQPEAGDAASPPADTPTPPAAPPVTAPAEPVLSPEAPAPDSRQAPDLRRPDLRPTGPTDFAALAPSAPGLLPPMALGSSAARGPAAPLPLSQALLPSEPGPAPKPGSADAIAASLPAPALPSGPEAPVTVLEPDKALPPPGAPALAIPAADPPILAQAAEPAPAEPLATEPGEPLPTEPGAPIPAEPLPAEPTEPGRIELEGGALPGTGAVPVRRPETAAPEAPAAVGAPAAPASGGDPAAISAGPLLSLVLLDDGALPDAPARLAILGLPLSVALDPSLPEAAARADAFRAAGFEVLALARLPLRAQPQDVEVFLAPSLDALPGAVAVLDLGEGGLRGRDETATAALSLLARRDLGAVLLEGGFGGGADAAEAAGVPAAGLLRDLDGAGQDEGAIRRGLDDAARRADQDGEAAVLARLRADTLDALTAWAEGRAAGDPELAPVSALLDAP